MADSSNGTGAAATVTSHIGEPTDGTRPTDISGGGSNNGTTGAQNGSGDKKKTNVGAIAGGVVSCKVVRTDSRSAAFSDSLCFSSLASVSSAGVNPPKQCKNCILPY